jgi:hypothetical protein
MDADARETSGDGVNGTSADNGTAYPDAPPPVPPTARVLRLLAVVAVVVAVLVGLAGIWRAQTGEVNADKMAEKRAHERAYSQLAGDPTGPGAARVENITITDAVVHRTQGSAAGTLSFSVYNSGRPVRLRSVTVTVGGAEVPRVLYVPRTGAEPQPLPGGGLPLATAATATFGTGGSEFALIGLPAREAGTRADVTVRFTGVGPVTFTAPVLPAG